MQYKGLFEMPNWFKNKLWPYLDNSNHEITSDPTEQYNCVAWAIHIDTEPIDLSLDDEGEPLAYPDLSCLTYIEYFQGKGFELCDTSDLEEGYEKIALFELKGKYCEHVARQLADGKWTSKLGEWEDIEHSSLTVLASNHYYGIPSWFMRRPIG